MDVRLNDVRNFVETATCKTISEAALKLEITQPALSESIKRFEQDLKQVLFYRSRTGINLTPSGVLVYEKAKKTLLALEELTAQQGNPSAFGGRSVTIGCHATVASYSLPKALADLQKLAPDFRLHLKHDLSRNIQSEIQKGQIDVGIVINPNEVPDLVIKKIAKDHVHVWTADADVDDVPKRLIYNSNLFQSQSIVRKWKPKNFEFIETDSLELIVRLVAQNLGYGIIPNRAVQLLEATLKKLTNLPSYEDEVCLVYRPEFGKSGFEKIILNSIEKSFKI